MPRSQRNRPNQSRRPSPARRPTAVDIWRDPGSLPDIEPIEIPPEVGALLRSLGDPPMVDGSAAGQAFAEVLERAAAIAAALAFSVDLLADEGSD
jgi:hypothetical protein